MKKLFHPLIPLFVLFLLAGKYGYHTFFSEKYDAKTSTLLFITKSAGESVSIGYEGVIDKIKNNMEDNFAEQGVMKNDSKLVIIQSKLDTLKAIYQKYEYKIDSTEDIKILQSELKKNVTEKDFDNFGNQYYSIQNLNLQTLFNDYLKEIKEVDNFVSDKYKDYIFEENQTDKELKHKYLKGRKIEILIHLARFKAELAQVYGQAVDTLVEEYSYFPITDKYNDVIFRPIIEKVSYSDCEACYKIDIQEITPFTTHRDTTELRKQIETNAKYYFDEKGFLVIDEKDFEIKNLKLKWYIFKGKRFHDKSKTFLEYGKEGFQYEK